MVNDKKLGVAVVGLGIGEQHARAYMRLNTCQLRWLYDINPARTQALQAELGQGQAAESYEQILRDPQVQVVSIASFDDAHYEQLLAALEAGKHVFVEKPLCRTAEELRAVKSAWNAQGGTLKVSSNLVLRSAPLYRWLKQEIDSQALGQIYALDGDYLYGRLHKITHGWRSGVEDYSVMLGGGVHIIDLALWITGERPQTVFTYGNRICTQNTGFDYNDYAAAQLRFPSGMVGRITANFGCVHRHQHALRVFGVQRTFIYDDRGARLHITRQPEVGDSALQFSPLPAGKGDLIAPFVDAIIQDADWREHTQTMLDVISVCAASDESMRLNSEIEVQYV